MSLSVPSVGDVPIVWMPASDEDFKGENEGGRSGYRPIAIVHHRIVGTLNSADIVFAANDSNPATVGSAGRPVSAHFAIGIEGNRVEVHQYVNLSDTAYCNGDDSTSGNWDEWYSPVAHNERTVSIEHHDNGGSSDLSVKGIVPESVIKTSIALDRLLLSGDRDAMRAAGIRIRDDGTAEALGKIVPGPRTLIDHRDIAGSNKPYCWRPWKADAIGFPRARYIAELTQAVDLTPYDQADLDAAVAEAVAAITAERDALKTQVSVQSASMVAQGEALTAALDRIAAAKAALG